MAGEPHPEERHDVVGSGGNHASHAGLVRPLVPCRGRAAARRGERRSNEEAHHARFRGRAFFLVFFGSASCQSPVACRTRSTSTVQIRSWPTRSFFSTPASTSTSQ